MQMQRKVCEPTSHSGSGSQFPKMSRLLDQKWSVKYSKQPKEDKLSSISNAQVDTMEQPNGKNYTRVFSTIGLSTWTVYIYIYILS